MPQPRSPRATAPSVLRAHRIVSAQAGAREGLRTGFVDPLGKASSMSAVGRMRRFDIRVMSPFSESGLKADVAALSVSGQRQNSAGT